MLGLQSKQGRTDDGRMESRKRARAMIIQKFGVSVRNSDRIQSKGPTDGVDPDYAADRNYRDYTSIELGLDDVKERRAFWIPLLFGESGELFGEVIASCVLKKALL